jgi:NADPH:quinone reductase-like Zn-dependent oxidoreductase
MRAAWRDRYGTPDVVEIREVERPAPTGDQVLVRVRAASVNRADLDTIEPRPGFIRPIIGMRAPRNRRMGIDAAGTVEAVGPDAGRFRVGDAVFADLYGHGEGAFAEFACATEKAFEPIPTGVTFEQAATLPHSAILALQGLRTRDGRTLEAGLRVLIVGASGNVGPFAVQLAKLMRRSSTTRRWTTRRPGSGTTGSSRPTRTTRSGPSDGPSHRAGGSTPSAARPGRSSRR